MTSNEKALLDTIAYSELGESLLRLSDNGYNIIVGSIPPDRILYIQSYNDHPRLFNPKLNSTAAGRYQILARIFDFYKKMLNLPDFSPESQDKIAIQLLRECKSLTPINSGDFHTAVTRAKSRWASLPGAGYGQHENSMDRLKQYFIKVGGEVKE